MGAWIFSRIRIAAFDPTVSDEPCPALPCPCQETREARQREGQPDADGWVLVTRHSKRPVARRTEGLDQRLKEKMKKKRQRQQLVNLYNFQIKDTKMERE